MLVVIGTTAVRVHAWLNALMAYCGPSNILDEPVPEATERHRACWRYGASRSGVQAVRKAPEASLLRCGAAQPVNRPARSRIGSSPASVPCSAKL